jgi:hypothetical protein
LSGVVVACFPVAIVIPTFTMDKQPAISFMQRTRFRRLYSQHEQSFQKPCSMTKGELLAAFQEQRRVWLMSARGRGAERELRLEMEETGKKQASRLLADKDGWRVSLLALGNGASIPIHDHPGCRALLRLERGTVEIRHFDVIERSANGRSAVLAIHDTGSLNCGDYDWIGLHRHNLHSLESQADFSLIFSVRQCFQAPTAKAMYAFVRQPGPKDVNGIAVVRPLAKVQRDSANTFQSTA